MLKHKTTTWVRAAVAGLATAAMFTALPSPASATAPPTIDRADERAADELLDRCPLAGPSTFINSWGFARSGGRSHEGVDMMADYGVPIVAVRDGYAEFKSNSLGGLAVWIDTPNGDRFYYSHLSGFEGESRNVQAGEVIGYVGTSGNATTPHLHFETLPGGVVENPYGHTLRACVPTPAELARMARADNDARVPLGV
jgi:murein DD-endopeptidase MepM/ murein hydrolase activator NlpD